MIIKVTISKKNLKDTKYINFNDEIRRLNFIKRVTILINITIFKIILYKITHRNIFIITNFIFNKSKNK